MPNIILHVLLVTWCQVHGTISLCPDTPLCVSSETPDLNGPHRSSVPVTRCCCGCSYRRGRCCHWDGLLGPSAGPRGLLWSPQLSAQPCHCGRRRQQQRRLRGRSCGGHGTRCLCPPTGCRDTGRTRWVSWQVTPGRDGVVYPHKTAQSSAPGSIIFCLLMWHVVCGRAQVVALAAALDLTWNGRRGLPCTFTLPWTLSHQGLPIHTLHA